MLRWFTFFLVLVVVIACGDSKENEPVFPSTPAPEEGATPNPLAPIPMASPTPEVNSPNLSDSPVSDSPGRAPVLRLLHRTVDGDGYAQQRQSVIVMLDGEVAGGGLATLGWSGCQTTPDERALAGSDAEWHEAKLNDDGTAMVGRLDLSPRFIHVGRVRCAFVGTDTVGRASDPLVVEFTVNNRTPKVVVSETFQVKLGETVRLPIEVEDADLDLGDRVTAVEVRCVSSADVCPATEGMGENLLFVWTPSETALDSSVDFLVRVRDGHEWSKDARVRVSVVLWSSAAPEIDEIASVFVARSESLDLPPAAQQMYAALYKSTGISDRGEAAKVLAAARFLNLSETEWLDLSALRYLPRLEALNLTGASVSSLAFLRHTPGLTTLTLKSVQIGLLDGLDAAVGLRHLSLDGVKVGGEALTSLAIISRLSGLETLFLARNAIDDLRPLQELRKLRVLKVADNRLRTVSSLAGISSLQVVDLSRNIIATLAGIETLSQLEFLDLSGNGALSSIDVDFSGLTELRFLGLNFTGVRDVAPLLNAKNHYGQYSMKNLKSLEIFVIGKIESLGRLGRSFFWMERLRLNPEIEGVDGCPLGFSSNCQFSRPAVH